MPEREYVWLPRASILSFEEIVRLVGIFTGLGVSRIRLTGGEPLVRRNVAELARRIAALPGIEEVSLSTNATRLAGMAAQLKAAGITRLNVSLDSLDAETVARINGRPVLDAHAAGPGGACRPGRPRSSGCRPGRSSRRGTGWGW